MLLYISLRHLFEAFISITGEMDFKGRTFLGELWALPWGFPRVDSVGGAKRLKSWLHES